MINSFNLTKYYKQETVTSLILCSTIFVINPLLGILTITFIILYRNINNEQLYYGLYILLALYLGLINSTKTPITDLLRLRGDFYLAGSMSFKEYLFIANKEIFFYGSTYLLYYILGANFKLYIILLTFIGYLIAFYSLHKYWRSDDKQLSMVLFPILLLFLYRDTFFYSSHLVRQTLAGFVFIYFLIEKSTNNRNKWVYLIIAIFIHTSVIFMFTLCLIPNLSKKLSAFGILKIAIIIGIIMLIALITMPYLVNLTASIEWLNYGLKRIMIEDSLNDKEFVGAPILYFRFLYFLLLFIVLRDYFFGHVNKQNYLVYNVFILFLISHEILRAIGYEFLQMRMMVYMHMFIPFIAPSIFKQNSFVNIAPSRFFFQPIIIMYAMYLFARSFTEIDYFAPISELIFFPVPYFFSN